MRRVVCLIQRTGTYRRDLFISGARKLGYKEDTMWRGGAENPFVPDRDDLLITWNRYGNHGLYEAFAGAKAPVLIVENGYLGKAWMGDTWYAISLDQHNGVGRWPNYGPERWNNIGHELQPYRTGGTELVALPQRGIGWPGVAMPRDWADKLAIPRSFRTRSHPGSDSGGKTLEDDLADAEAVLTWGSGAAIKALAMGIPVVYDMPNWIAAGAATKRSEVDDWYHIPKPEREPTFQRMAWAMWRASEIESGDALKTLIDYHYLTGA